MTPILIINSAPFTGDFVNPIIDLYLENNIPFMAIDYTNIPESLDQYSGVIISASPRGDDIIDEQLPFYQWLKDYDNPVLGSCHGHQLMSILFGSQLIIGNESEEGMHAIEMKAYDELLIALPGKNWMVEQHHIKSTTLPNGFIQLASSDRCSNQIMKHNNKPMYGCQFHIESQPELLMNFSVLCDTSSNEEIIIKTIGQCGLKQ